MEGTYEEKLLYELWKKTLPDVEFGLDDDFFDLGGTSLQAMDIISQLSNKYELDIKEVFETATIHSIASTMKLNPTWAEDRLKFIFQKHEKVYQDKREVKNYKCDIRRLTLKRCRERKYKSVLLLGATGYLGAYILREFLENTDCTVVVIARAEDDDAAAKRVAEVQNFYFGNIYENGNRLHCYAGDLTKEYFGLSEQVWKEMAVSVEAVLNSAAMVKHMGKTNDFIATNVEIVRSIANFSKNGKKKDIHHVSSIGIIFGEQPDIGRTIYTEFDFDAGQKLDNNYLQSKFDAEQLLYSYREQGINAEIYRLNGILFDSTNGKFQKNIEDSSVYIFIKALNMLKLIPDINEYKVDISMVDQIARGIVRLMLYASGSNQTYHMIHPHKVRFDKLIKNVTDRSVNFKVMDAEEICRYYRENVSNEVIREAFDQILFNCEIFDSIMKNKYTIRQDMTVKALRKVGFRWKRVKQIHLKRAYNYVKSINYV